MWKNRNPHALFGGNANWSSIVVPKKKKEILYDPEIPLSGIYLTEENENTNLKRYMHPYI